LEGIKERLEDICHNRVGAEVIQPMLEVFEVSLLSVRVGGMKASGNVIDEDISNDKNDDGSAHGIWYRYCVQLPLKTFKLRELVVDFLAL
jgi:hypothetical protein